MHTRVFVAPPADRNQRLKQAKLDAASDIAAYREKKERKFASAELQVVRLHKLRAPWLGVITVATAHPSRMALFRTHGRLIP